MKFLILLSFVVISSSILAQTEIKNHIGLSIGMDPGSFISTILNNETGDSPDEGTCFAMGVYYKYKPLKKWDFDAGIKIAGTGTDEFYELNTTLSSRLNIAVFSSANYSTKNPFSSKNYNPFFSSVEVGYYKPTGNLSIYHKEKDTFEKINNLSGNIYFEGKIGVKLGWENNALGLFIAVNNMGYVKSANKILKKRELTQFSEIGGTILLGMAYEFGLRKKKKQQTTYPDWFHPDE